MNTTQLIYLVFSGVILVALILDLGLLSKKNTVISLKNGFVANHFLGIVITCLLFFYLV